MGRYYEFFAGGGMARAGLGTEWSCLFANDIDPKKVATYARNWGEEGLKLEDVKKLRVSDLPEIADLAWASFPCQDLSLAGDGAGLRGERSGTFWPFFKLVEALSNEGRAPRMVVLENVCGALTSHGGEDFRTIGSAIADAGYRFGALIIDAVSFLPQSRPRLFIIAVDRRHQVPNGLTGGSPNEQWHSPSLLRAYDRLPKRTQDSWLWWNLPSPPMRNMVLSDLIEDDPRGVDWHTTAETRKLLDMMTQVNKAKVVEAQNSGQQKVGTIYKRTRPDANGVRKQRAEIRFDDVAGCLRTPSGGSSRQTIMLVEGSRVRSRLLSPREAARLMGLPDDFQLPEKYNEAYHLAGDGVAVPVVRFIADNILNPIVRSIASEEKEAA